MKDMPFNAETNEVVELVQAVMEDRLEPESAARLDLLIRDNETARWIYSQYMNLYAGLAWDRTLATEENPREAGDCFSGSCLPDVESEEPFPHVLTGDDLLFPAALPVQPIHAGRVSASQSSSFHSVGGWALSYIVATVVVGAMLLGAWAYKIVNHPLIVHNKTTPDENFESQYVGRITGLKDCVWVKDSLATMAGASVPMGRKYELISGLMEINYTSGARVILEGPCEYTADSRAGGLLRVGKLVARVEKKVASGEWRVASVKPQAAKPESRIPNPESPASSPQPMFSVRTPTAIVTDLGTEFGVEVAKNGDTTSHVFRGSVRVQSLGGDNSQDVVLYENESASVQCGADGKAIVVRQESSVPGTYVCRMPQWMPFDVFSTGVGLKEGETDPHWQIVARSDQPEFKPQPAVVTSVIWRFQQNDPATSQWISAGGELPNMTEGVTFTFRTSFELEGISRLPKKSVRLTGKFMADNHVSSVRLNGREIEVPKHGYQAPFSRFHQFAAAEGFINGANVLEIDVLNEAPGMRSSPVSPMALRVELDGRILRGGRTAAGSSKADKTKVGKEGRK